MKQLKLAFPLTVEMIAEIASSLLICSQLTKASNRKISLLIPFQNMCLYFISHLIMGQIILLDQRIRNFLFKSCKSPLFTFIFQAVRNYSSFSEMLQAETISNVLPGISSIEEGNSFHIMKMLLVLSSETRLILMVSAPLVIRELTLVRAYFGTCHAISYGLLV
jgi:hypothetical protein